MLSLFIRSILIGLIIQTSSIAMECPAFKEDRQIENVRNYIHALIDTNKIEDQRKSWELLVCETMGHVSFFINFAKGDMGLHQDLMFGRLALSVLGDKVVLTNLNDTLTSSIINNMDFAGLTIFFSPVLFGTQDNALNYFLYLSRLNETKFQNFEGKRKRNVGVKIESIPSLENLEISRDGRGKMERLMDKYIYLIELLIKHQDLEEMPRLYKYLNDLYSKLVFLKLPYEKRKDIDFHDLCKSNLYNVNTNNQNGKKIITASLCLHQYGNDVLGALPNDIKYIILLIMFESCSFDVACWPIQSHLPSAIALFKTLGFYKKKGFNSNMKKGLKIVPTMWRNKE